jgi:hypothetical protein
LVRFFCQSDIQKRPEPLQAPPVPSLERLAVQNAAYSPYQMDSLVRKRKKKMSKHRYEKRMKKMKALLRRLGK